ncbi:MAG TPA: NUDIX domain-containing protein, partial [Burkholderiales bacterium]|nr:NUDIX domain-containing protein [Burkholderiales bacterium]
GVWASMWSFPEMAPQDELRAACAQRFAARVRKAKWLPLMEHGFSHFELQIRPVLLQVDSVTQHAAEPGQLWLNLDDAERAALPAPVRKLLRQAAAHV